MSSFEDSNPRVLCEWGTNAADDSWISYRVISDGECLVPQVYNDIMRRWEEIDESDRVDALCALALGVEADNKAKVTA